MSVIKLFIATINDEYIDYLKEQDKNVMFNKSHLNQRKYIGIVFKINEINYFVPLSSPKPKHKTMKNDDDFYKLKNGELGAINFNNMIPIPSSEFKRFSISKEPDYKYKRLLQEQYKEIDANSDVIVRKAETLYHKIVFGKSRVSLVKRCCDFKLLEKACQDYIHMNRNRSIADKLKEFDNQVNKQIYAKRDMNKKL